MGWAMWGVWGGLLPVDLQAATGAVAWEHSPPSRDCSVLDEGVFPQFPLVLVGKGLSWEVFALIAFYSPLAGPGCPQAMVSASTPSPQGSQTRSERLCPTRAELGMS